MPFFPFPEKPPPPKFASPKGGGGSPKSEKRLGGVSEIRPKNTTKKAGSRTPKGSDYRLFRINLAKTIRYLPQ